VPVWRIVVPKDGSQCARPVHVEQHRTPSRTGRRDDGGLERGPGLGPLDQGLYKFSPSSRSWP